MGGRSDRRLVVAEWRPSTDFLPSGVRREETLEAFKAAFAMLGYTVCDHEALEREHEKIAFFANVSGKPTHAARQLPNGRWTSKLGQLERIEHDLRDLEGDQYGTVALVMKRPLVGSTAGY